MRTSSGKWVEPASKSQSLLSQTTARFLGKTHDIGSSAVWNDPAREKLWLYNLHYFDDLTSASAANRSVWHGQLIHRWIAENPPAVGNGWEPYPTALRIVNWIKWSRAGNEISPIVTQSLAVQTRWLAKRVEHHLLANHLFVNAKALIFAGIFFEGSEADAWLAQGLQILAREIREQVLADGGHFERSPMYHAIILEDLLDLINASTAWPNRVDTPTREQWKRTAGAMLCFLAGVSHPDGEIAFFNDAAFGIAPTHALLAAYGQRLGLATAASADQGRANGANDAGDPALAHFQASGYIRAAVEPAVLLVDVAAIGPDYQPGHAHADTLSFELSLFGHRVLVNSGTSTYVTGSQRSRERSTAAHNTLEINGCDSSEVWGGFRVARRARVVECTASATGETIEIAASHNGYQRLKPPATHHRRWTLTPNQLVVTDTIRGEYQSATARFYLHPSVTGLGHNGLQLIGGQPLSLILQGGTLRVEAATWHPEFGVNAGNLCLICSMTASEMTLTFRW